MRNNSRFLWVAVLATVMAMSSQVLADTVIGVNFVSCWPNTAMSGKTFDGLSNWTDSVPIGTSDAAAKSGTGLVVLGSNNCITCDWSSVGVWYGGQENTWDQQLYRGYLDDGSPGVQVTIKGIAAWLASEGLGSYVIRIYQGTDNGASFRPIHVKSGDTILETVQSANPWTTDGGLRANVYTSALTADTIVLQSLIRSGSSRGTISGFKIIGISKYIPINPVPKVGAEVPVNQILGWTQVESASNMGVTYKVYFGTDPNSVNLPLVKTTTTNSADFFYDPELINSTTYYWRVDALEPNLPGAPTVHTGEAWWFKTQPPSPRIETNPVSQTVPAGTNVQMSVAGINITSYQWYKDGAALAAAPALYTGEKTATLTILDVQVADEGFYYCVGDNSLNQPSTSASAQLLTQRLVGWWKLDGNLEDSIDQEIAGAAAHDGTSADPNFVAVGKDGGALQFFGGTDDIVTVSNSVDFFNFYPRGYTVSVWVNMPPKTGADWGSFVSKQQREAGADWKGFILTHQPAGQAVHTLRQSFGDLGSGTDVDDNNWHLVTGTYNAATKVGKIYVDGALKSQTANTGAVETNPKALIFGEEVSTSTISPYSGLLDDIRIWSYPLDDYPAALLWTDFNPGMTVCLEKYPMDVSGPEGTPDCIVNLYDFAAIADKWLTCNRVPESTCP